MRWIYSEDIGDFIRLTTALAVGRDGSIWAGLQDFPMEVLSGDDSEYLETAEAPYISSLITIDRNGNVVRRAEASEIMGCPAVASEIYIRDDSAIVGWAGMIEGEPLGILGADFSWTPSPGLGVAAPVSNARLGALSTGLIGWFNRPQAETSNSLWLAIEPDLGASTEINRLTTVRARFLESDPSTDTIWATIDDGEIFQIDASTLRVTSIWDNRLPSGAPAHPIDDAAILADGLAILDREHRAIMLLAPGAFAPPGLASEGDVAEALRAIRASLWLWKDTYGEFPQPSPGLLDKIMYADDRETVRRAFLGGTFFQYRPSETGFTFVAWIATPEQPVLICDQSTYEAVY
jgi:hypothetical protein